jgi:prepilin-type N-terminal cleavage/methylation domain-containing protein
MSATVRPTGQAGFTLIELMVVTAIIGILASLAIPGYTQLTLRSRTSERGLVMSSIKRGIIGLYLRDGKVAMVSGVNPAVAPGTAKAPFNSTLDAAWAKLSEVVQFEGAMYYQYDFAAVEPAVNTKATLDVTADGDLDGDKVHSVKTVHYERRDGVYWTDDGDTTNVWCATSPMTGCNEDGGTF